MSKNNRPPMYIMTEDEFQDMKRQKKREALLKRLEEASKNKPKSIVTKPDPSKLEAKHKKDYINDEGKVEVGDIRDIVKLDDDEFGVMVSQFNFDGVFGSDSTIDDIAMANIVDLRLKGFEDEDELAYQNMFKEEIAMISEVLKSLKEQSKKVGGRLKEMGTKLSGAGAPKSYSDLISAYTSLESAKLSAIKEISNLKLKREELRLKDSRNQADDIGVDEMVDQYYNLVMNGNRSQMIDAVDVTGINPRDSINDINIQGVDTEYQNDYRPMHPGGNRFNLSKPINTQSFEDDFMPGELDADEHGYISNEARGVDVIVQRFASGRLAFAALDQDGESVDDYELPDSDLVDDMTIRPGAKYAYDRFGRKYPIMDIDTGGLPLDDIDDD